ncbi:type II toxin-antitoxin system ParD family antitoxin [Litorimonas sp.]|uniref:type II toxin-antitoxin system ParD family antitoxin n=1 Tax=Litorimonas sp. TaxID=1892381 RepID=UPI003A899611
MPSSYALGSHFEDFMSQLIKEGRYNSKSEILREGLRAIEDREQQRAIKLEALKSAVMDGVKSGPGIPSDEVRQHFAKRRKS